jgi:hypothetical protein
MRNWLIAASLLALSGSAALAQTRPDTLRLSCGQVSSLVQMRGSAVLASGPNLYDRYVSGCEFCYDGEFLQPAWVRTKDSEECSVGYICKNNPVMGLQSCGITGYSGKVRQY